jgi:hypothetical protein
VLVGLVAGVQNLRVTSMNSLDPLRFAHECHRAMSVEHYADLSQFFLLPQLFFFYGLPSQTPIPGIAPRIVCGYFALELLAFFATYPYR